MPASATIAPIDRSMPRTRIGNAWPIARIATKEKPDIRFSMLPALAKRGANREKERNVAAKNSSNATVAGLGVIIIRYRPGEAEEPWR